MTLLALVLFATPAALMTGRTRRERLAPVALAAVALIAVAAFGHWRLATTPVTFVPDVSLRIMQPNISQREKNRPASGQAVLSRYIALSDRATGPATRGLQDATHLVWPESPFPFLLAREPRALSQIAAMLKGRATLVTGAARAEDAEAGRERYFNAIHVVEPDGTISASYDKTHLVPFGEYLPFRDLADRLGLRQFVEIPGGFEPGRVRRLLAVKGLPPALPLICYEAIFGGALIAGPERPGVLINVTNDAWFGQTPGPYQHLAQARLRAIEQGVPLVRAANTGISAVIDPLGRTVASLPLGMEGVLDSPLPAALAATIHARNGDVFAFALLLICMIATMGFPLSTRKAAKAGPSSTTKKNP
jgi:apolipoprotein N-acyltransferase